MKKKGERHNWHRIMRAPASLANRVVLSGVYRSMFFGDRTMYSEPIIPMRAGATLQNYVEAYHGGSAVFERNGDDEVVLSFYGHHVMSQMVFRLAGRARL